MFWVPSLTCREQSHNKRDIALTENTEKLWISRQELKIKGCVTGLQVRQCLGPNVFFSCLIFSGGEVRWGGGGGGGGMGLLAGGFLCPRFGVLITYCDFCEGQFSGGIFK